MKRITVNASKKYDVLVGNNLLEAIGEHIGRIMQKGKVVLVSDSNVCRLYSSVSTSLKQAGYQVFTYAFPQGEQSKNTNEYLRLLSFFAENGITRSDLVIALGGGVVGDLAGFASATYMRGISYVQIPTTLLAMVDSSVGGKVAIDLPEGKNLVGAFYQPSLVLCDIACLKTLPENVFLQGCAEVIKYGFISNNPLYLHLKENKIDFDREYVICESIMQKAQVVEQDEFDLGLRQTLNLGHSVGHTIEILSNFTVSHGEAVAMGLYGIGKCAYCAGDCSRDTFESIKALLDAFGLMKPIPYSAEEIYKCILRDKKVKNGQITLVVPNEISRCSLKTMTLEQAYYYLLPLDKELE